jgi:putative peptide zinc metalloprotease protein
MPETLDVWASVSERLRRRSGRGADVWDRLHELTDLGEFRPKLRDDIEIRRFEVRLGDNYAMLANPRELLHYRLDWNEADLLPLMDGTRTVREIVVERFQESGELELSGVADLVYQLHVGGFLDTTYLDVDGAVDKALHPRTALGARAREFATTLRLEWKTADRFVRWLYEHGLKSIFTVPAQVASLLVVMVGLFAFLDNVQSGRFSVKGESIALDFLILLGLQMLHIFIHELGHAIVLVHYGRRVKAAGFFIFFGAPAFFIESSDGLMLDRRERIIQSAAGPYSGLIVAGTSSIIVWLLPDSALTPLFYKFTVLAYLNVFINSLPLLELDGYWILADAIQIPDLRPRSLAFVRHELPRRMWRREGLTQREWGLAVYGVVGFVFTVLSFYSAYFFWESVFGGLVRSLWRGGTTGRIVLLALALFVGSPLIRALLSVLRAAARTAKRLIRRLRFRFEREWRVEAAQLIDALPVFDDVPVDVLNDVAGRVALRRLARGRVLIRQGERAEAFFVVRKGTFAVMEEDPETEERRTIRLQSRGDSFGELGLLAAAPRTASVVALEESEVFEVDKSSFERLLADMIHVPEFAPTFQQAAELRSFPAFAHLEPDQLASLRREGSWVTFPPGTVVMRQGAPGDAFYAIGSGRLDVVQNRRVVATLGPGDHFGEVALLLDVPRTATIRARTAVRAFRLERRAFRKLVARAFRRGTLNPHSSPDRSWEH